MRLTSIQPDLLLIPKFNGNRDLPKDEQVKIHFSRIPGTSEKKKYFNFRMETGGSIEMVDNYLVFLQTFVKKVENLISESGKDIKDGVDLSEANDPALGDLMTEIADHVFPDAKTEEILEGESQA